MKWFYCQKETFEPIKNINPIRGTYYLGFSAIDLATPDESNNDMKFLLVRHDAPVNLELIKPILINLIKEYDKSDEINCVYIGEDKTWFDKNTRSDLISSLKIQKEAGKTDTKIWYNVGEELKYVTMNIDDALDFFNRLVLYAAKTFDVTESHIQAVNDIDNIDNLMAYNITADYPAYIKLTTKTE